MEAKRRFNWFSNKYLSQKNQTKLIFQPLFQLKRNKTKILVTGSKGLIGGEFYSILKSEHFNVKGVDTNFNIQSKKFLIF